MSTRGKTKDSGNLPKSLKVDRSKFEGIVKRLINADPVKREDVTTDKRKPGKLIPPQK